MTASDDLRDSIDAYRDTIFAILGFANFYRFDDGTRQMRDDVTVFQGRRLTPSPARAVTPDGHRVEWVTPDVGIVYSQRAGVLGEAKCSLPRDRTRWMGVLTQLMGYDDDLTGWPSLDGRVDQHDVVLLIHQSRVVDLCEYCEEQMAAHRVQFSRPLAVICFNRADQRQPYFHFEKRLGHLSEPALDSRLHRGVPVPMARLVAAYPTVKIYDAEPPLPWMAHLIWEHVVAPRASDDPRYPALHRNQKIEVSLTVDEIADDLHRGFSFQVLCPEHTERQPRVPCRQWCVRACDALVSGGMARWVAEVEKSALTFYFRKLDNVLEAMLEVCTAAAGVPDDQLPLFGEPDEAGTGRPPDPTE